MEYVRWGEHTHTHMHECGGKGEHIPGKKKKTCKHIMFEKSYNLGEK